jgi:spore maturation protein CgeB
MRFVLFCHSLVSDWNHGNAHFLRGVCRELQAAGHEVAVFEPEDGWSRCNMVAGHGQGAINDFNASFPDLRSETYRLEDLDLNAALDGADVVIVHEWSVPEMVARISDHRLRGGRYLLLFHDTHHRAVTAHHEITAFRLDGFDGVLAFGEAVADIYRQTGWGRRVWVWHEAADTSLFRPMPGQPHEGDLVWIGNWGDDERTAELHEYLLQPVRELGLKALVHGVRYPDAGRAAIAAAGAEYRGWLPNHRVPQVFARYTATVHVPRRPYVESLPGVPTIRVFEALACGIPLVSAPWQDSENLFRPGEDFLFARNGIEMKQHLRDLCADPGLRRSLVRSGLDTIERRHTCRHRVSELLGICSGFGREMKVDRLLESAG